MIGGVTYPLDAISLSKRFILGIFWRGKIRKVETDFLRKLKIKVLLNNIVVVSFQYEVLKKALGCKNKRKSLRANWFPCES